jgi:signal transduction histidine kinase
LHDETLQALGNLRLVLSSARRSHDPGALAEAVDQALEQLGVDITSLRSLITDLRPGALDQLGLEPALLALVERVRRTGLEVECQIELAGEHDRHSDRLVPELEVGVYRIVQEALTNVVKHGGAGNARLQVIERDRQVSVLVSDDGQGFDPTARAAGFGLMGMRERSELLSAHLSVQSAVGTGTVIRLTCPAAHRLAEPGVSQAPASLDAIG